MNSDSKKEVYITLKEVYITLKRGLYHCSIILTMWITCLKRGLYHFKRGNVDIKGLL